MDNGGYQPIGLTREQQYLADLLNIAAANPADDALYGMAMDAFQQQMNPMVQQQMQQQQSQDDFGMVMDLMSTGQYASIPDAQMALDQMMGREAAADTGGYGGMSKEDQLVQDALMQQYGTGGLEADAGLDELRQAAAIEEYLGGGGTLESGYTFDYDPTSGQLSKYYQPTFTESLRSYSPIGGGQAFGNMMDALGRDDVPWYASRGRMAEEQTRIPLNY